MPRWVAALVVLAIGLAGGYGIAAATSDDADEGPSAVTLEPSWLFVVVSEDGALHVEESGHIHLGMSAPRQRVAVFSDRPYRVASQITVSQLIALWGEGESFASDPPNAAFEFETRGAVEQTIAVELTKATFSRGAISFEGRALDGEDATVAKLKGRNSFESSTLFVDVISDDQLWAYCMGQSPSDTQVCEEDYRAGYGSSGDSTDYCSDRLRQCANWFQKGYTDSAYDTAYQAGLNDAMAGKQFNAPRFCSTYGTPGSPGYGACFQGWEAGWSDGG